MAPAPATTDHLEQSATEEENRTPGKLTVNSETEGVPVERDRDSVIHRTQQHPAVEYLHGFCLPELGDPVQRRYAGTSLPWGIPQGGSRYRAPSRGPGRETAAR